MTDDGFSEYRRLIEDFIKETRQDRDDTRKELHEIRTELTQLRTQLTVARWLITPLVAALAGGGVAFLFKRFGG
jgi:hypothetical protein